MSLSTYFETTTGTGRGQVDAAVYSRPHVMADGTIAFIMKDRLSRHNLQSNPHAAYLFIERGNGFKGKRLFLKQVGEEKETERLYELRRRSYPSGADSDNDPKYLVFFELQRELPLVGGETP
jgi:hypothetical protein